MNIPTVRSCNCRRCTKTEAQASPRPTPPAVGDGTTSTGGEGSSLSPAPGAPEYKCERCRGRGFVAWWPAPTPTAVPCPECEGTGRLAKERTVPDQGLGGNLREQDSVGLELGTPQGPSADFERFVRQLDTGHGAPRATSPAPGAPAQFLVVEVEDVAFWPERPEPLRRVIAFELDGGFTEALRADRLRHPRSTGGHA